MDDGVAEGRFVARTGLVSGFAAFVLMRIAPAPEGLDAAAWATAALGVLMAIWWMTEALPIPATALLPILVLPIAGVAPIRQATAPYANPLIFLFLGGFLIAIAMQRWQLHRRLALTIIAGVGTGPRSVIAGFMIAGAVLSMWISNTATTMMMLPIALSVVGLVTEEAPGGGGQRFSIALLLGIAYACSIGGLGTLIGTPTNALLAAFLLENHGIELSFSSWMVMALPLVIVGLGLTFVALTRWVYPTRMTELPASRETLRRELDLLGPLSRQEKTVALVFALTAVAWMTRPLIGRWLPGLSDTGVAVCGALALFVLPSGEPDGKGLLRWRDVRGVPWGVLLLFGGGLSLASAVHDTGLASWLGSSVHGIGDRPELLVTFVVVVIIILLTELTSNTATAAAFLPVLAAVAVSTGRDPMSLLVPATLAASCAFMLPVATPPNAIVYGSGRVPLRKMMRAGLLLNALFSLLITLVAYAVVPWALRALRLG
jgi:sodium-dependent dicarboxylate transporter 2/3/5